MTLLYFFFFFQILSMTLILFNTIFLNFNFGSNVAQSIKDQSYMGFYFQILSLRGQREKYLQMLLALLRSQLKSVQLPFKLNHGQF